MSIPQELYDSEINFEIATDSEAGFRGRLGHWLNGYDAEVWADSFDEVADKLRRKAIELYPNSRFAREYKNKLATAGVLTD